MTVVSDLHAQNGFHDFGCGHVPDSREGSKKN